MTEQDEQTVIRLAPAQQAFCLGFLGWQCRLRQMAVRQADGRPTSGMRPHLTLADGTAAGPVTVLICKAESREAVAQFRHMVRKTHDPAERYQAAQRYLAAAYYQRPQEFDQRLTALFGSESPLVARLLKDGTCRLDFAQYSQRFSLPCRIDRLTAQEALYQATYWHNSLYNPAIPAEAQILAFAPDWAKAEADPPIG